MLSAVLVTITVAGAVLQVIMAGLTDTRVCQCGLT